VPKDVTLTIDGTPVTVPEGTLLVEAAKLIRTDIPVYCYHPKLGPAGLCRICLVDVEKTPKLQIACNTGATDGMVVHTRGSKVEDGRRAVLEFLLLNHPLDCPICDKGGECDLQDFSMAYGQSASRLADPKASKPKAIDLGPTIVLDDERCIVCQRCTRFDEIITQEHSLVVMDRGQRDVIATATGEPYRSNFSGNVTELCPVGALTSKTYRFKSRPWDLQRTKTTCTQCSVGCAINLDERHGEVLRTMSVEDDVVSDGWLCDRGRYNVGFATDPRRITSPLLKRDGEWTQITWDEAIELWAKAIRDAVASAGPGSLAALGGARLLNQEAYLLQHVMRAAGCENLDWRTGRQRQASPGPFGGTYADIDAAQAIVLVGRPPAQTAPILSLRIRKAVAGGARLIFVSDHAVPIRVRHERLAKVSELASLGLDKHERLAFVWDGIDVRAGAELSELVQGLAASGKAVSGFVPGESPNARGAEAMGLIPRGKALDAAGILASAREGALRVLSIFGANPVLSAPGGPERASEALKRVPFVVVTELFMTASAELATLLLPARGAFEKYGHTYDLTGVAQEVRAGHAPPAQTLSDGEIVVALAAALNIAIPAPAELDERATAPAAQVASGLGDPALCGKPAAGAIAKTGSVRLAIATDSFAGGGTVYFDDRLGELRPKPTAKLNERTAALCGVRHGDAADIVAGDRVLGGLSVVVYAGCVDGVVTVFDGLPDAPASDFNAGETVTISKRARTLAGAV